LESLCKKHGETIKKLKENMTLEMVIQSRDELIMEIAAETRLGKMGEDDNEDDNDDDDEDGRDVATPPATVPPAAAATLELVVEEEEEGLEMLIPDQEAPKELEIIVPNEEPKPPQPRLFTMLMRDHEESPLRMYGNLDDPTLANYDVDEWFLEDGSRDHD
jgi:hypothetical protein